ncbi:MAG: nuclear transport factor 2 family protein [Acidimicrobiales bacterium]
MTAIDNLNDFHGLAPFFRIIEEGLKGVVDGDHFFDLLADDVLFEYVITVPGYPRRVTGRQAVAELYRPYSDTFNVHRCFDLATYHDCESGVVVLEYACEGHVVPTGAHYGNRFVSVITINNRKITRWRDYLDPIAVFEAIGWPPRASAPQEDATSEPETPTRKESS